MKKLAIISPTHLRTLKDSLSDPARQNEYRLSEACTFIEESSLQQTTIQVDENAPSLIVDETNRRSRTSHDAHNAEAVYGYIRALNPTQAADPRLWSTLTHTTFWVYSRRRWPVPTEDAGSFIAEHWLMRGSGLGALSRNSISRLWWAAHLTVAPWEKDPSLHIFHSADRFRFTKVLLSIQQVLQDLLERSLGSDLRLRTCMLHALELHKDSVNNFGQLSINTSKQVNLLLKYLHLDALPTEQLTSLMKTITDREANKLGVRKQVETTP